MRKPPIPQRLAGFSLAGARGAITIAVIVVVAFALGGLFTSGNPPADESSHDHAAAAPTPEIWTCSMHPQIKLPQPGQCPICGMDLIPLDTGMSGETGPRQLRMSETARLLARIQTTRAIRAFAETEVRMYGRIAYDESRVATITAWVPGRLDRLYADYTGVSVKKGDHLVYMYSPVLLSAQEELIQALAAVKSLGSSNSSVLRSTAQSTVAASREKLRLYGLTPAQIRLVEETGTATDHLTIFAPAGGVVVHKNATEGMYVETGTRIYTIAALEKLWVLFEAYESDLSWIHYGQRIQFTSQSFPGETFEGIVSFVDPLVDPKTRTVRVRAVVDNTRGRLKPDMFVRGVLHSRLNAEGQIIDVELAGKWICPMHPEFVRDARGNCDICGMDLVTAASLGYVRDKGAGTEAPLLIPSSAPLITGKRAVVYVELEGTDGPIYEGREVALGPRAGDYYPVRSGIREGERVVTNGAFKIDSELQIQAKPSMMSPEGGATAPGHNHGDPPRSAPAARKGEDPHAGHGDSESPTAAAAAQGSDAVRAAIAPLYNAYFGVQMALAKDDLAASRDHASSLADAVGSVDMAAFSSSGHKRWMELSAALIEPAKRLAATRNLEDARDAFFHVSATVIDVQGAFGHPGDNAYYLTYCPMARSGDGAYWLQTVDTVWNSFYGARMLRCGSIKGALAPAHGEGEQTHDTH